MRRFLIAYSFLCLFTMNTSRSQAIDPATTCSFSWNIPSYNLSGSFTMNVGMMRGVDNKSHGYFKFMDESGTVLTLVTPATLDSLKTKLQHRLSGTSAANVRATQIQKIQIGIIEMIDKLKSTLEDEQKMMAIVTSMNSRKANGSEELWNWSHTISTVRNIQELVTGSVDW